MTDSLGKVRSWFSGGSLFWPAVGLGLLFIFNAIFASGFLNIEVRDGHLYGAMIDIVHQGAKVMLLAIGMTLVIGSGGVDLSVGSIMAIAGAVAAAMVQANIGLPAALLAALGIACVAGLCNGLLVSVAGIQPIIATLILMVAGRGVAMLITNGQILTFENPGFVFLGNGHFLGLPFTLTVVLVTLALTLLLTRKTAIGLFLESLGDNERAARYSGVPTRLIKTLVYVFSGLCAGIAGLIAASNIKAADSSRVGEMLELDAIFAVVVGGTALTGGRFTLLGSILGALLIQTLTTTMYNLGVPPSVAPVPKAIVILAVCLMQSSKFREHLLALAGRKATA
ncbi:MAG TPA: ABC transporter permease [Methylomirabilota bacterium]|nr:ABC transporter permease [Methylomirabilota bacterium]